MTHLARHTRAHVPVGIGQPDAGRDSAWPSQRPPLGLDTCDLFGRPLEPANRTGGGIIFSNFTATRRSSRTNRASEAEPHSVDNRFSVVARRNAQARARMLENLQVGWVHLFATIAQKLLDRRFIRPSQARFIAAVGRAEADCFKIVPGRSYYVLQVDASSIAASAWFGRLRQLSNHHRPTYLGFDSHGGFDLNPPDRNGHTDYELGGLSVIFPVDTDTNRLAPDYTANCMIERHRRDELGLHDAAATNEEREATIHELVVHCWRAAAGRFSSAEIDHAGGAHASGVEDSVRDNQADRESDLLRAVFGERGVDAHGRPYHGPWHWPWVLRVEQL